MSRISFHLAALRGGGSEKMTCVGKAISILILCGLFAAPTAQAAVVAVYDASLTTPNPVDQGWTDEYTASNTPSFDDTHGEPAWQMNGGGGVYSMVDKFATLAQGNTGPWAIRFRANIISSSANEPITTFIKPGNNTCYDAGPGDTSDHNVCPPGTNFSFFPWDGRFGQFNEWLVVHDGDVTSGGTDTVTYKLNGEQYATFTTEQAGGGPAHDLLAFGHSGHSTSNALWSLVLLGDTESDVLSYISHAVKVPVDYAWNSTNSGSWEDRENWQPTREAPPGDAITANFSNNTALFGDAISAPRTVILDSAYSLRTISFDNSNTYAIAGTGSVSLVKGTADDAPTNSKIEVVQGSHQFQLNVHLENNTDIDVSSDSLLEFNNRLFFHGNTLTKTGAGTLSINHNVLTDGGTFNCSEGVCSGTGTISGDLINEGGIISPGYSAGGTIAVPEPTMWLLFGSGMIGAVFVNRCRRRE